MSKLKTAAMFTLMLPMMVSYDSNRGIPDPVNAISEAVTDASEKITRDLREGRHLGFDTYAYPGDDAMRAWREEEGSPYEWVGYYLPSAPCHKGDTWEGKRQTLSDMGWGVAVIYVGQQVWSSAKKPELRKSSS